MVASAENASNQLKRTALDHHINIDGLHLRFTRELNKHDDLTFGTTFRKNKRATLSLPTTKRYVLNLTVNYVAYTFQGRRYFLVNCMFSDVCQECMS